MNITGKRCVVVGGGRVAERKVQGILSGGGQVLVISPEGTAGIRQLAESGKIDWEQRAYRSGDLKGTFLVFAATSVRAVQAAVVEEAREKGVPANVADAPAECDFQVPATIHHGDLTIAVSTNGTSPAVAAMVKKKLQEQVGDEYRLLLRLMAMVRRQVLSIDDDRQDRKILFQKILHEDIIDWIKTGQWEMLQEHLQHHLGRNLTFDLRPLQQDEP